MHDTNIESHLNETRVFQTVEKISRQKRGSKVSSNIERMYRESIRTGRQSFGRAKRSELVWQRAVEEGAGVEGAVRQMVHRRKTESFPKIAWTDICTSPSPQQSSDHLGR